MSTSRKKKLTTKLFILSVLFLFQTLICLRMMAGDGLLSNADFREYSLQFSDYLRAFVMGLAILIPFLYQTMRNHRKQRADSTHF